MATSTSWTEFASSFIFMAAGLSILVALFAILHFFSFFKRLLASRMYMKDKGAPDKAMENAFAWVMPMLRTTETEVIKCCGLDAAVYLRMFRFSAEITLVLSLLCCPILITINALAANASHVSGPPPTSTDYLTVSNMPKNSAFLWAHFTLLYVMSGFVIYWTARAYRHIWGLRHSYLAERSKVLNPEEYTVLVSDIPEAKGLQQAPSMIHVVFPRGKEGKEEKDPWEQSRESFHGKMKKLHKAHSPNGDASSAGAASFKKKGQSVWSSFCFWTEEKPLSQQEEEAEPLPAYHDAPEVLSIEFSKKFLRSFFAVLRVVTLGFIQPPTTIDATPAGAVSESRRVDAFFHRLYPGAYLHNQGVPTYVYVQKAYHKWRRAVMMLDRVRFRYAKAKDRNEKRKEQGKKSRPEHSLVPHHRTGFLGCFGPRVESIPFWIERVKVCTEELREEQENASTRRRTGAAFVIFNSRRAASVAVQTSHAVHGTAWLTHLAPEPQDVLWGSMGARFWERTVRKQLGFVIFIGLVVFFYLPVSVTTLLTSISTLEKLFPGLSTADHGSAWYKVFIAVVPPLGLRICYWIAPDLLIFVSYMQGSTSASHAQQLAATRFYYLLLFNVWFLYLLTDTVINTIVTLINDPKLLLEILALSVPSASGFFMAFILTSTFVLGLELLRLPIQLFVYLVRMISIGKDICDREKLWNQGGIVYHVYFPYQNFILTLGLIYACIAPLVLPVVLLYSLVGYFVFKHQVMYVYSYPYQTGGLLWIPFVRNVLIGLMIAQLTAIVIFGLKQCFVIMGLAVPLPVVTYYALTLLSSTLNPTFTVLPLELAVEVDEYNERTGMAGAAEVIGKEYMPIAMRPVKNPDLAPDAGPADNIHELINPAFIPSQLKEALDEFDKHRGSGTSSPWPGMQGTGARAHTPGANEVHSCNGSQCSTPLLEGSAAPGHTASLPLAAQCRTRNFSHERFKSTWRVTEAGAIKEEGEKEGNMSAMPSLSLCSVGGEGGMTMKEEEAALMVEERVLVAEGSGASVASVRVEEAEVAETSESLVGNATSTISTMSTASRDSSSRVMEGIAEGRAVQPSEIVDEQVQGSRSGLGSASRFSERVESGRTSEGSRKSRVSFHESVDTPVEEEKEQEPQMEEDGYRKRRGIGSVFRRFFHRGEVEAEAGVSANSGPAVEEVLLTEQTEVGMPVFAGGQVEGQAELEAVESQGELEKAEALPSKMAGEEEGRKLL